MDKDILEHLYLLESAVSELAELNGHSSTRPISFSLFCLQHELTLKERDDLILLINKCFSENKDANFVSLKEQINIKLPKTKLFSDKVMSGMIEILKKDYLISD
ncbi:hypothetical protein [Streptococcus sp. sy018]|uniref:hypothetical protein n=1 Tax=Streptococcus sp. sy018 TaxID=2600147 RepID=UPI0011B3FF03|nr:hypothetical protein [Streptococcus sp. sy018]TWS94377.1 hypothetical protein FRX52_04350 [Streptococcus sp. sy018]